MGLINSYIEEVGSYLPKRLQDDVARELRSNLEEGLEDRLSSGEWTTTEDAEVSLLTELGPPHELAESYMPGPRVLFGPRLYPPFIRTMTIALSVLGALKALSLVVDFIRAESATEFWMSIIGSVDNLFMGAFVVLGAVVAIFAVIERTTDGLPAKTGSWDPRSLEEPEDSNKALPGKQVVGIVCLVLTLVALNLFPDKVGVFVDMDENSGWIPILNQFFWQHLWLLNIGLGLDLVVQVLVLRKGEWNLPLRWVRVGVGALYVVWLANLVYGPGIFEVDYGSLGSQGWPESATQRLGNILQKTVLPVLNILLKVGFAAAVIGLGIRIFKTTRESFTRA
jgi:hypothetical protein